MSGCRRTPSRRQPVPFTSSQTIEREPSNTVEPTPSNPATAPSSAPTDRPDGVGNEAADLERLLFELKKVIVGQDRAIERMLTCLLAGGHCLLESVPGLAKTLSVETLASTVGGSFSRIQFTPDLLPADLIGTRIYRASTEQFDVELGPVFANFVLADEINRAPAKVQSALLEVMAEHQVTIGGKRHEAPDPFLVLATQNPIESEGVYPLPEAQRDRFLMKVVIDYPTPAEEVEIVQRMGTNPPTRGAGPHAGPGEAPATCGRQRLRRPQRARVRGEPGAVHPHARELRPARAPQLHRARCQPPRVTRPRPRRARPGAPPWPVLPHAAGRVRRGSRDHATPDAPLATRRSPRT